MATIVNDDLYLLLDIDGIETKIPKDNCQIISFGDIVRITDKDGFIYEFNYIDITDPAGTDAATIEFILKDYLIEIVGGGGLNNTTYTLIDCGTIVAPNENVLIDCGTII
jgi:hypothetical protein